MTDIKDTTAALRKEAEEKLKEAERIEKLQIKFPDLQKYVGRWNKTVYCSKSINTEVTEFETRFNCGCCNDSPFEIWPYVNTEHGKVYTYPPMYMVGNRDDYVGVKAYREWKKRLTEHNISETIINQVEKLMLPEDDSEEPEPFI